MEGATAVASPGGRHEVITLQSETTTPRRRTLSASFVRERTPSGELPAARRQRMKNTGKAQARALIRLDPAKHDGYLAAERARKRDSALRAERDEIVRRPGKRSAAAWCSGVVGSPATDAPSPPWKQQARERVAAELQRRAACEARLKEAQDRWYHKEQERMAKVYGPGSYYAKLLQAHNGPAPDSKVHV